MNFFEHQEQARKQSKRMLWLFAFAVLCIVVLIDLLVVVALAGANAQDESGEQLSFFANAAAHPGLLLSSTIITACVILFASLYKISGLREGGAAVAREMGATLVPPETSDFAYRRLRNVIEEIAIASGVPVPEIYVLEHESGINAFAAGYSPADAAVCVTRGALERLTRDELQGVIAHEFSHVLNGDMKLNIKLMGLIFGILLLGLIGQKVLEHGRGGRDKNGGAILAIALGLMVIGYVGVFFGRLIKAKVSRQREFLADASAVQFTRQAVGIAGALKKAGALSVGSKLETAETEEVAHMLFSDGIGFNGMFATHPSLEDRIKRIEPRFDPSEFNDIAKAWEEPVHYGAKAEHDPNGSIAGYMPKGFAGKIVTAAATGGASSVLGANAAKNPVDFAQAIAIGAAAAASANAKLPDRKREIPIDARSVTDQVANPASDDYQTADTIHASLPDGLKLAAQYQEYAPALVLALALDGEPGMRAKQLQIIGAHLDIGTQEEAEKRFSELTNLHPIQHLPLAALAFPALRRRPRPWLEKFIQTIHAVIHADGVVNIQEYCLAKLVSSQVIDALQPAKSHVSGTRKIVQCQSEIVIVCALLAEFGHDDAESARKAFQVAINEVLPNVPVSYAPPKNWREAMDGALGGLDQLNLAAKQMVIQAFVKCISHDGRIAISESELLRIICASMHCPLPPMLSNIKVA